MKTLSGFRSRRLLGSLIAGLLACISQAEAGNALTCDQDWQYTKLSLQSARGLLRFAQRNPKLTPGARIACAEKILAATGLSGSFTPCDECSREYAGLLADTAVYMRRASKNRVVQIKTKYLTKEVGVRRRLHQFLLEKSQRDIQKTYLPINLQALADAMHRVGQAEAYHQVMADYHHQVADLVKSGDRDAPFFLDIFRKQNGQVFREWILAIRSCPSWDFAIAFDSPKLQSTLCGSTCRRHLEPVSAALKAAQLLSDGRVDASLPFIPTPKDCAPKPVVALPPPAVGSPPPPSAPNN